MIARLAQRLAAAREVSGAVVLALDGAVDPQGRLDERVTELYVPDRFVAEETARYPNLRFGASVNPRRRDALERLDAAAASGAVLVKWLPPVQGIDPADPRHAAFYRRPAELGLPLLTHTGTERSFTRSRDALGDPERLRLPVSLGVTVIAAHGAAAGRTGRHPNLGRLAALAREHSNLWADVSSLTQVNHPGALVRRGGERRPAHPVCHARGAGSRGYSEKLEELMPVLNQRRPEDFGRPYLPSAFYVRKGTRYGKLWGLEFALKHGRSWVEGEGWVGPYYFVWEVDSRAEVRMQARLLGTRILYRLSPWDLDVPEWAKRP